MHSQCPSLSRITENLEESTQTCVNTPGTDTENHPWGIPLLNGMPNTLALISITCFFCQHRWKAYDQTGLPGGTA